jgi:hypothetical protein
MDGQSLNIPSNKDILINIIQNALIELGMDPSELNLNANFVYIALKDEDENTSEEEIRIFFQMINVLIEIKEPQPSSNLGMIVKDLFWLMLFNNLDGKALKTLFENEFGSSPYTMIRRLVSGDAGKVYEEKY